MFKIIGIEVEKYTKNKLMENKKEVEYCCQNDNK